jgi:ABC-type transport system involved in multi-copper enzyme maturation permease subunit
MTFIAILVKEMRLRMRRERTIWILVLYVLLLGLLAWFILSNSHAAATNINQWNSIGFILYHLLTAVQLLLILFITPAFTATAINGEKERQTYEMLICSRLSSFSLVTGKLVAGLSNSLLLIAASIPLFSLVFFFGGIAPATLLQDLLTFIVTAVMIATLGFLCSAIFPRPAISTAVTYMIVLLWLVAPIMVRFIAPPPDYPVYAFTGVGGSTSFVSPDITVQVWQPSATGPIPTQTPTQTLTLPLIAAWNPLIALNDTLFMPLMSYYTAYPPFYSGSGTPQIVVNYGIAGLTFTLQAAYAILSGIATVFFFGLSLCFAKPNLIGRIRARLKRKKNVSVSQTDISEASPGSAQGTPAAQGTQATAS